MPTKSSRVDNNGRMKNSSLINIQEALAAPSNTHKINKTQLAISDKFSHIEAGVGTGGGEQQIIVIFLLKL
jgi:hypothetical protein